MIICVNIGNTNIRCALGTKDKYRQAVSWADEICSKEDFQYFLEDQFSSNIWEQAEDSVICSVVPEKEAIVAEGIYQKLNKQPCRIEVSNCGLDISKYKSRLGVDRAVCSAAAFLKYKSATILVDLGTATTINVISSEMIFLGGAIMPGVKMGLSALSRDAALLPQVDDFSNVLLIGNDTTSNLVSGAVIGVASAIEGYVRRITEQLGSELKVIITGGHAPIILPYCEFSYHYDPTLLVDGLFMLYKSNTKEKISW